MHTDARPNINRKFIWIPWRRLSFSATKECRQDSAEEEPFTLILFSAPVEFR